MKNIQAWFKSYKNQLVTMKTANLHKKLNKEKYNEPLQGFNAKKPFSKICSHKKVIVKRVIQNQTKLHKIWTLQSKAYIENLVIDFPGIRGKCKILKLL